MEEWQLKHLLVHSNNQILGSRSTSILFLANVVNPISCPCSDRVTLILWILWSLVLLSDRLILVYYSPGLIWNGYLETRPSFKTICTIKDGCRAGLGFLWQYHFFKNLGFCLLLVTSTWWLFSGMSSWPVYFSIPWLIYTLFLF
jgi:hypothetical protein